MPLSAPLTSTPATPTVMAAGDCSSVYTVRMGDTLTSIAGDNSVTLLDLEAANPLITEPNRSRHIGRASVLVCHFVLRIPTASCCIWQPWGCGCACGGGALLAAWVTSKCQALQAPQRHHISRCCQMACAATTRCERSRDTNSS